MRVSVLFKILLFYCGEHMQSSRVKYCGSHELASPVPSPRFSTTVLVPALDATLGKSLFRLARHVEGKRFVRSIVYHRFLHDTRKSHQEPT